MKKKFAFTSLLIFVHTLELITAMMFLSLE